MSLAPLRLEGNIACPVQQQNNTSETTLPRTELLSLGSLASCCGKAGVGVGFGRFGRLLLFLKARPVSSLTQTPGPSAKISAWVLIVSANPRQVESLQPTH